MADRVVHSNGEGRFSIFCPGCKQAHVVNHLWSFNGDMDRPTFSPSLLVRCDRPPDDQIRENLKDRDPAFVEDVIASSPPRVCHSFVRDGRIEFLSDCTHELAGKTAALEPW